MKKFALAALVVALGAGSAEAQQLYSNTTTWLGQAFSNGGSAVQTGNTITRLVADDITAIGSGPVGIVQFSVANQNTSSVTVRPRIRFYDNDGAGGAPGTFLAGFSFNPILFGVGVTTVTSNLGGAFIIPLDGTFWAGITFDNNTGGTGATQAQLDLFGQGIFNPPTVGSSADIAFRTTLEGSFLVNNPAGATFNFGAGGPVANFGWQFNAIPEPTTWALIGLCSCGALPAYRRWKAGREAKNRAVAVFSRK